jgi:hypothetical protein
VRFRTIINEDGTTERWRQPRLAPWEVPRRDSGRATTQRARRGGAATGDATAVAIASAAPREPAAKLRCSTPMSRAPRSLRHASSQRVPYLSRAARETAPGAISKKPGKAFARKRLCG